MTKEKTDFQKFCARMGLPEPVAEHRFHPERKWRFDHAWVNEKLAIECDGGIWVRGRHAGPSGILKDMEKFNAAACLGWRVLKVTPKSYCTLTTYALVKSALGSLFNSMDQERAETLARDFMRPTASQIDLQHNT